MIILIGSEDIWARPYGSCRFVWIILLALSSSAAHVKCNSNKWPDSGQCKLPKIIQFQVSVDNNTMSRSRRSDYPIMIFHGWKFATLAFSDSISIKLLTIDLLITLQRSSWHFMAENSAYLPILPFSEPMAPFWWIGSQTCIVQAAAIKCSPAINKLQKKLPNLNILTAQQT